LKEPWPLWVKKAGVQIVRAFLPGTASADWHALFDSISESENGIFDFIEKMTPLHRGRCIAQMLVLAQTMETTLATHGETAFDEHTADMKSCLPGLRDAVKDELLRACDLPAVDSAAFFRGFSSLLNRKRKIPENPVEFTETCRVYYVLIMLWLSGKVFHTTTEMHKFFRRFWGTTYSNDIKQIQKLCQRIGYPTCPPGRPRTPRNLPRH